ncbi:MarR family transcriptional regulator [Devosia sp. XK-2]|uniref:MarR family winged helix-turn-helix transcriptional regulator n=1 Tax=Devosia sp. XK-2 TaxID=3126689 RepID=UPI0030CDF369
MSSPKQSLIADLGLAIMRWQDQTQKFDELVGRIYALSASERLCLSFLMNGPQTASAIAREIQLTPAAVTTLLDRLERRSFVRRQADPADRRKVMVVADAAALALARDVYAPMAEAGAAMLDQFTLDELKVMQRVVAAAMAVQEKAAAELEARGTARA